MDLESVVRSCDVGSLTTMHDAWHGYSWLLHMALCEQAEVNDVMKMRDSRGTTHSVAFGTGQRT